MDGSREDYCCIHPSDSTHSFSYARGKTAALATSPHALTKKQVGPITFALTRASSVRSYGESEPLVAGKVAFALAGGGVRAQGL